MLALVFEFGTGQLLDAGLSAKVAVALYSAIQLASGLCYLGMWRYATGGRRLVDPDLPDEWVRYLERIGLGRIVIMSAAVAVAFVIPPLSEVLWVGVIFNRHRVAPPNRARAP
jgi:hypothetical protein